MTDYTPTTEEVRNKYSWWTDRNLVARGIPPTDTEDEFDRWLAEVKAQEAKAERERAIAILKERHNTLMEIVSDCAPDGDSQNQMIDALNDANNLELLIALIKGEEQ